jgi:hypothetical protein
MSYLTSAVLNVDITDEYQIVSETVFLVVLFRLFCGAKAGKSSTKGSPKSSEVGTEPNNLSHHARCYSDVILALAKAELARREAH